MLPGFAGFCQVLLLLLFSGCGLRAVGLQALVCSGLGSGLERAMLQQQTHKAVLEKPLARPRSIIVPDR